MSHTEAETEPFSNNGNDTFYYETDLEGGINGYPL